MEDLSVRSGEKGFGFEEEGEMIWVKMGFQNLKTRVLPVRGPRSCEQGTSQLRGPNTQNIQKFQGVLAAATREPRSCETHLAKILYFSHTHSNTHNIFYLQTYFIHSKTLLFHTKTY